MPKFTVEAEQGHLTRERVEEVLARAAEADRDLVVGDLLEMILAMKEALRSCAMSERSMFVALDRFGLSTAANFGSPLVPIPMEEMMDVAAAKAEMVGSMAGAERLCAAFGECVERPRPMTGEGADALYALVFGGRQ